MALAAAAYERTGEKQRVFADLSYGARSWNKERRVIARLEHGPKGANPRYVITNLEGEAKALYERLYCARGEMENRIKEQQLALSSPTAPAATSGGPTSSVRSSHRSPIR